MPRNCPWAVFSNHARSKLTLHPVYSFRPETQLINIRKTFMSSLYLILPPRFSPALTTFLRSLLHSGPSPELSQTYSSAIQTMMGLLDRYDPLLFGLIYEEIEKKVETDCKGEFEEPKLVGLLEWLTGSVLDWVSELYARPVPGGLEEAKKMLKPTFARFEYHVHKTLGLLRFRSPLQSASNTGT